MLRKADFLSFEELKSKTLGDMLGRDDILNEQPAFVGKERWLPRVLQAVTQNFENTDGFDASSRVVDARCQPGTFVGCSKSGKSRSLREIFAALRQCG